MSTIFDLDPAGGAAADAAARATGVPLESLDASSWNLRNTGLGADYGIMSGLAAIGRPLSLAASVPAALYERATGQEGRYTDDIYRAMDQYVNSAVDFWTPTAQQVGTAGLAISGFAQMVGPLALGVGNPSILAATQATGRAVDLVNEGVDAGTAVAAGMGEAALTLGGFKIPFLGKSFVSRMASGFAANEALGIGGKQAEKTLLEQTGNKDQAAQINALDPTSLVIDGLMGLAFGGIAQLHAMAADKKAAAALKPSEVDAVLTAANAKHFQQDTAPGVPADVQSSVAHQDAMEQAIKATLSGEPVVAPEAVLQADFIPHPRAGEPHISTEPIDLNKTDELPKLTGSAADEPTLTPAARETMREFFHGSPHEFDAFDMTKIGTGEGAQAYGHGIYFAEKKAVAEQYILGGDTIVARPEGFMGGPARFDIVNTDGMVEDSYPTREAALKEIGSSGNLYQVHIPAKHVANMLDWDKPLSEQPPAVREKINALLDSGVMDPASVQAIRAHDSPGSVIYKMIANDTKAPGEAMDAYPGAAGASRRLDDLGVRGIKYFDGGSRAAGDGTHNVVLFDPKDAHITHKNGEPVSAQDILDAKDFGLPIPPHTLPEGHPLLTETHTINTPERVKLREKIVRNIVKDAVPVEGRKPIAFVMGGGGASGKGTVLKFLKSEGIVPETGAVHVDPDAIKEQIPEYGKIIKKGDARAAATVHEESSLIAKAAVKAAIDTKADITLDRTMSDLTKATAEIQALKDAGYEVQLFGVTVEVASALKRAVDRAKHSMRYVPLDALLRAHKGFAQGFEKLATMVDRVRLYDNEVPKGENAREIATKHAGEPALRITDERAYNQFVQRSGINEQARTYRELAATSQSVRPEDGSGDRRGVRENDAGGLAETGQGSGSGEVPAPAAPSGVSDQRLALPGREAGPTQTVYTATQRAIDVTPRLIEASELLTSDRQGYPAELQPRQRGDRVASSAQIRAIAANLQPELLGDSAEADRGAPIISRDGVVESGNGRVMALREVYANHPEKAAAYQKFLKSKGLDTSGMKYPVLVRVRETPLEGGDRRDFTVEANQSATAPLSAVERAQTDARLMDADVLEHLKPGDIGSAGNVGFVRAFLGRLPVSEQNALLGPDGQLSQEGLRRVQAGVLAKAYGGSAEANRTLGRMLESTDADLRSVSGALLDAAPRFAQLRQAIEDGKVAAHFDIAPKIIHAVEQLASIRAAGQGVSAWLAQVDMLTPRDGLVDEVVRAFYTRDLGRLVGRDKIASVLERYAREAVKQRLDQESLFGGEKPLDPAAVLKGTTYAMHAEEAPKPTGDMFGLRTAQGGKPNVAVDAARQALAESDIRIPTGEVDPQGNPVIVSGRERMAQLDAEVAESHNLAKAFPALAACIMGGGTP